MEVLVSSPLLDEVIVVDDGSTDRSLARATEFQKTHTGKVAVVRHPRNMGKADALITGAKASGNPVIFFCDADLTGFTVEHIKELIEPFLAGEADLVTGVQEHLAFWQNFRWGRRLGGAPRGEFMKALGGEKVLLKRDFLSLEGKIRSSDYGLEQIINDEFKRKGKRVKLVTMKCVGHEWKVTKWGLRGIWREVKALFTFGKQYVRYFLNPKG